MDTSIWATIFGAGGLVTIVVALIKGVTDWLGGAHAREKQRNVDALAQRDIAWQERDAERSRALAEQHRADLANRDLRRMTEYASTLRVMAIGHGIPLDQLPAWPPGFFPTVHYTEGDQHEPPSSPHL